eukprot:UN04983
MVDVFRKISCDIGQGNVLSSNHIRYQSENISKHRHNESNASISMLTQRKDRNRSSISDSSKPTTFSVDPLSVNPGMFGDDNAAMMKTMKTIRDMKNAQGLGGNDDLMAEMVGDHLVEQIDGHSGTASKHLINFLYEAVLNGGLCPTTSEWLWSYLYTFIARIVGALGVAVAVLGIALGAVGSVLCFILMLFTCCKVKLLVSGFLACYLMVGMSVTLTQQMFIMFIDPYSAALGLLTLLTNKVVSNSSVHAALIFLDAETEFGLKNFISWVVDVIVELIKETLKGDAVMSAIKDA